ncbi:latrophilin receptor-like protein A [Dreissena polymorpha]|uniref:latrophilin receptor-like protein A n=1 Tax=Dreissena polymorpha TaxID=45954 RepID=UPI002264BFE0|nr:latrophilin receptor-like protein A [Dreissena polymorpha]
MTKQSGTCFIQSPALMKAWTDNICLNGARTTLNVPSKYHVFARDSRARKSLTEYSVTSLDKVLDNDRLTGYPNHNQSVTTTGILSLVCMIISVICLLITLLTYCLFQELRTQPGINNMGLVISLIVAQVLFQFGKGQHQYVPSWTCELIGVLIHFFWLLVIFWMNVCCWHMFCLFNRLSVQSSKQSPVWKTFIYTIYTFVGSLLCVAINIIVVVVDTDNEKVGYGDGTCYISRPEMVGYTFALPVFIILVANIAMFCVVILKVKRTTSHVITSAKSNVNYVTIFAKLATLVGLSWIFGFIYTYTGKEVFEYLFIILSNGQGVFIFVAFICRKRVYHLYKVVSNSKQLSVFVCLAL